MRKTAIIAILLSTAVNMLALTPWTKGAFETGRYRNIFAEMGYDASAVDAKLKEVFCDVFHGPDKVYFEVGDSMGYISDIKNHDVRTEGMSYGMMIAVQFGEKDIFDRLWRWSKRNMQHQDGPRKGYFAWSCRTDGIHNAEGAASDGELYYITALIFASNRWGNDSGINYLAEAQHILSCIQPRGDAMYLIDPATRLITFTPDGYGRKFTDPSYHIPAFYEVWARWADDGRSDDWYECARRSREFLHKVTHPATGLNPDLCQYDGSVMQGFGRRRNGGSNFRYDSWRVPMNIALDYEWSCADAEWQCQYGERIQDFFFSQGVDTFVDQYRVDGTLPADEEILAAGGFRKLRHSIGLIATLAAVSVLCSHDKSKAFVDALWNARHAPFEDGYFDAYYDGLLRLFAFMHLSGNYRVIKPSTSSTVSSDAQLSSPNGRLTVAIRDDRYIVSYDRQPVLAFSAGESTTVKGTPRLIIADYEMLSGKRRHCTNQAYEYHIGNLTLRVYNDGIAFRTDMPSAKPTIYHITDGTRRWLQKWVDSYEGFYPLSTTAADGRWAYPALLEPADGIFALITEADIRRGQSASSLHSEGTSYRVVPAKGAANEGLSPWSVAIIGPLADIVQSTLVTDVATPCQLEDTKWIQPGVVSWIYWAYNHGSNDYNIIKKYVDMAVTLKLPYVLIDAEWDKMGNGKTIEDAVAYARKKDVKPLIWYNSSIGWVNGAPTPLFRLNKPEDREKEFAWCERMGVAGVKIDFFSGDTRMNMDYCIDLLESAARHHLLVNFHGATLPRGWQRTYPHLLTTEGVYGAEWYNNVPTFTRKAARHNATLPFTRNVVGPMDYTPCTFSDSQHPHITTHAHELALTVLFESGLQHLADRPESYLAQPGEVQQFFRQLPAAWDETRFVSGYPGESAVLARRSGQTWYVAGINGSDEEKTLQTPLDFINNGRATLFTDNATTGDPWLITHPKTLPSAVACSPRGGFLLVVR